MRQLEGCVADGAARVAYIGADVANKLFPAGKNAKIRLTVEGGETLTMRLDIALDVLEFFAKMKGKE